jgi:trimeric autotransporter adhesin
MTYVSALIAQADLRKLRGSTIERKQMSTKTIYKRIALVAVASLGAGLLSVAPANAAALLAADMTQNVVTVRTDDVTYPVDPAVPGSLVVPAISINESAANNLEAAAFKITYKATSTGTETTITKALASAGAATAATVALTGNVLFKITPAASGVMSAGAVNATAGQTIIASASNGAANAKAQLLVGRGALPGIYTVYMDITGSTGATFASDKSLSITVTGAPASVSVIGTGTTNTNTVIAGDTTSSYVVSAKDAAGRATYLLAGESIALTENGTGLAVTTPAIPSLTSAELSSTQATMSSTVILTTTSLVAGTYTLTATPSMAGVAAATGSLVYTTTAARIAAASIILTSPTTQVSGSATAVAALPVAAVDTTDTNYYSNSGNTSFTFRIKAAANTTGFVQYSVAATGVTTSPAAGGNYTAALTVDATASYADVTVAVSSIALDGNFTVTAYLDGDGDDPGTTVTYKTPVFSGVKFSNPDAADIAVKIGTTTTLQAKATDQYGNAMANQTLYFDIAGRSTTAVFARVTDASGLASVPFADVSTSTTSLSDTVRVDDTSGGQSSGDKIDTITLSYATDISATAITSVGYIDAAGTYNGALKADGTTSVTIDAVLAQTATSDQFYIAATLKNAAGAVVRGLPVVFTVTGGIIAAETDTTAATITAGKDAVTTVTVYTDSNGVARAAVAATKVGSVKVTATSGTLTTSQSVTAKSGVAGTGRTLAVAVVGDLVRATVVDGFGNGVGAVSVVLVATGGAFLTGSNTVTVTTDATGLGTASLQPGTGITVKATMDTDQETSLAAAGVDNWVAGNATATSAAATVTASIAPNIAALTTLVNSLIAKINALNKLVIKIQKKVRA